MDYDNDFQGVLFKNDKRDKESSPNYRGDCTIGGSEFWLSCWLKTSKKGTSYMSLAFTPKQEAAAVASTASSQESDAPF